MTKDEIKALISAKVAGQGDQVDAGGALAQILNGIIDAIPEIPELPIATKNTLGGIMVGDNLNIDSAGTLSASGGGAAILSSSVVSPGSIEDLDNSTKANVAERLGVSATDIDDIAAGKYAYISFSEGQILYPIRVVKTTATSVWIYIGDTSLADSLEIDITSYDEEEWTLTVRV